MVFGSLEVGSGVVLPHVVPHASCRWPRVASPGMDELEPEDRVVLEFERLDWLSNGRKEVEIRERFGVSATRYYQRLNHLLDVPAAEVFDPELVHRLRRVRERRRAARVRA